MNSLVPIVSASCAEWVILHVKTGLGPRFIDNPAKAVLSRAEPDLFGQSPAKAKSQTGFNHGRRSFVVIYNIQNVLIFKQWYA